jgi:hypothetical protein
MRSRFALRSTSGITILEITILLTVTMALVGALAPAVSAFLRDARIATATAYMAQMKTAILDCLDDISFPEFKVDGDGKGGDDRVRLLVSDGDIPQVCNVSVTDGCGVPTPPSTTPEKSWLRPVQPDSDGSTTFTFIDFLDRHLVLDAPGNNTANAYVTTWRGSYINAPIDPDPWGNRYMFSAQNLLLFPQTANLLSAGPDEAIDTTWDLAATTAGADDLVLFVN